MKYSNPKIPEGINTSPENPLKEFALLACGAFILIVLLVTLLSYLLDWGSQYIPFSYEQQIAQPFVSEFADEHGEVDAYLQGLADEIVPLMALEGDVVIKLHYVNKDIVNAMATVGGNIFIYRGLLEKLPSENALVMLLAHEIAHVKLRHPVKTLSKGVIISLLLAVISGQSSSDMTGFLNGTSQLAFLNFSRSQEQDADNEAVLLSQNYYHHTQGANELFGVLLAESEQAHIETMALLRSHPEVIERMNTVTTLSQANNWPQQGEVVMFPNEIIEKIAQDKSKEEQEEVKSN